MVYDAKVDSIGPRMVTLVDDIWSVTLGKDIEATGVLAIQMQRKNNQMSAWPDGCDTCTYGILRTSNEPNVEIFYDVNVLFRQNYDSSRNPSYPEFDTWLIELEDVN